MLFAHKPDHVAVLETRISSEIVKKLFSEIGRKNWLRVETEGFSPRIELWLIKARGKDEI